MKLDDYLDLLFVAINKVAKQNRREAELSCEISLDAEGHVADERTGTTIHLHILSSAAPEAS